MRDGLFILVSRFRANSGYAKELKFFAALLAIPLCAGSARALWRVLYVSIGADTFWIPMLAGGACWFAIYALLPKPLWIYVFGHELTHAIWAWAFGGKVKSFKVSSKGGYVALTKTNFLISLAPYFFPLYAAAILAGFIVVHVIWELDPWLPLLHLLLGMAYCFHLTLTWHALKVKQTDVTDQGWLFSAVVIWLGNIAVLLCGLPLLTGKIEPLSAWLWVLSDTRSMVAGVATYFRF